jgi:putative endonuclease
MDKTWYVYILECGDGTLYTGITDDVQRRLQMHRSGKGAKYTRGRLPLQLRYQETCGSYSDALRREARIKKLTRAEKLQLIREQTVE